MRVTTGGGLVTVSWYDSDFEPTCSGVRYFVRLYVDGVPGSVVGKDGTPRRSRGNPKGAAAYEDGGVAARWDVRVTPGVHQFAVALERLPNCTVGVGVPYTDPTETHLNAKGVPYTVPGETGLDSMSVQQVGG